MFRSLFARVRKELSHSTPKDRCRSKFGGRAPWTSSNNVYAWGISRDGSIPGVLEVSNHPDWVFNRPHKIDVEKELFGVSDDESDSKETNTHITHFSCGYDGSGAVLSDGSCLTWGRNHRGQLGHRYNHTIKTPTAMEFPSSGIDGVKSLILGETFSAAIDTDGDLYTFGSGTAGQLGHGDWESFHPSPKRVDSLVEDGCKVKQVEVGSKHMAVLTNENELLTAGAGDLLGISESPTSNQPFLGPVDSFVGSSATIRQISCGHAFTLALDDDGIVYAWGQNDRGQLGICYQFIRSMKPYEMLHLPAPIWSSLDGKRVVRIAAGHSHSACVTDAGELFVWGMQQFVEPELVLSSPHIKCVDVACGIDYTMVLSSDGKLYCFGLGRTGVLGHGSHNTFLNHLQLVEDLADEKVVAISAGARHFYCNTE